MPPLVLSYCLWVILFLCMFIMPSHSIGDLPSISDGPAVNRQLWKMRLDQKRGRLSGSAVHLTVVGCRVMCLFILLLLNSLWYQIGPTEGCIVTNKFAHFTQDYDDFLKGTMFVHSSATCILLCLLLICDFFPYFFPSFPCYCILSLETYPGRSYHGTPDCECQHYEALFW